METHQKEERKVLCRGGKNGSSAAILSMVLLFCGNPIYVFVERAGVIRIVFYTQER
jgi:hypothetical protein